MLCTDTSEVQGLVSHTTIKYDYLVYAVGAETQTFNIPGVREHACFMKELDDAERVRHSLSHCFSMFIFRSFDRCKGGLWTVSFNLFPSCSKF